MTLPIWALYAVFAAMIQALQPLLQEHFKINGLVLAFGIKLVVLLLMLPVMLTQPIPTEPMFYVGIALLSVVWCISDVQYFRAVPVVGAGVVSRLLPATTMVSFMLWFAIEPSLLLEYAEQPLQSAGIIACVLAATWCAMHLSKCEVSRRAVRLLWFVLLACCVAPPFTKLTLDSARLDDAPFAFAFFQALAMLVIWSGYILVRHRPALAVRPDPKTMRRIMLACLLAGLVMATQTVLSAYALMAAEHPSYVTVILFTDALWIIAIYKLVGRRETANVAAGLGIVGAAAALVLLKSL